MDKLLAMATRHRMALSVAVVMLLVALGFAALEELTRHLSYAEVRAALLDAFERWDGKGVPGRARGAQIQPVMRIVHIADDAEVHHRTGGVDGALEMLRNDEGQPVEQEALVQRGDAEHQPAVAGEEARQVRAGARLDAVFGEEAGERLAAAGRFGSSPSLDGSEWRSRRSRNRSGSYGGSPLRTLLVRTRRGSRSIWNRPREARNCA